LIYLTEDGEQKLELDMPVIDKRAFIGHFSAKPTDDMEVPFVHACSLIRRRLFDNLLFDDRSYRANAFREETDFYINALSKGYKVYFCPHTFAYHLARERDPRKRGGIWPRTSIEYKLWRQFNNIVFCWKNRRILASRFGVNFIKLELNFVTTTLINGKRAVGWTPNV
jgi:GT2 family glycosyltransferase